MAFRFCSTPVQSPGGYTNAPEYDGSTCINRMLRMRKRLTDSFANVLVHGGVCQTILSHSNSFSVEKEKRHGWLPCLIPYLYCRRWHGIYAVTEDFLRRAILYYCGVIGKIGANKSSVTPQSGATAPLQGAFPASA